MGWQVHNCCKQCRFYLNLYFENCCFYLFFFSLFFLFFLLPAHHAFHHSGARVPHYFPEAVSRGSAPEHWLEDRLVVIRDVVPALVQPHLCRLLHQLLQAASHLLTFHVKVCSDGQRTDIGDVHTAIKVELIIKPPHSLGNAQLTLELFLHPFCDILDGDIDALRWLARLSRLSRLARFSRLTRLSRFAGFARFAGFSRFAGLSRFLGLVWLSRLSRFARLARLTRFSRLLCSLLFPLFPLFLF